MVSKRKNVLVIIFMTILIVISIIPFFVYKSKPCNVNHNTEWKSFGNNIIEVEKSKDIQKLEKIQDSIFCNIITSDLIKLDKNILNTSFEERKKIIVESFERQLEGETIYSIPDTIKDELIESKINLTKQFADIEMPEIIVVN